MDATHEKQHRELDFDRSTKIQTRTTHLSTVLLHQDCRPRLVVVSAMVALKVLRCAIRRMKRRFSIAHIF
jgi:hypothetical protein